MTELQIGINLMMEEYLGYFSCNGLAINVQKTNIICFRPHAQFDQQKITYDGKVEINTCKLLGVVFDRNYTFSVHVSRIKHSVKDKIKKLKKVKFWMDKDTRKEVYSSICKSVVEYCLDIYGRLDGSRKILQVTCNKIYREILLKDRYTRIVDLHNELGYLSVNNMYRYLLMMNLLNLLNYETSPFTYKQLVLEDRLYKTRNRFLNTKFVATVETVRNSWIIRATDTWNKLQCFKIKFVKPELYKEEIKGKIREKFPNISNDKLV